MQFISKSKSLLATLALAALAGGAQADVVNINVHSVGNTMYTDIVSVQAGGTLPPVALWNVQNSTTGDAFLAYCMELLEDINQGSNQTYTSGAYTPSANVRELYDRYYGSVLQSRDNAVGFQLALWELLGSVDVTDLSSFGGGVAIGESMLATVLGSNTGYTANQYTYTRWSNTGLQDVLQVTRDTNAVPEPQTHALMLGGLGLMAMGMVSRRRQNRQSK